jgi:two-component system NtrC family sensor kinase
LFLEFFHDVTEQKRLREELVQSAKLAGIGTLASGIAHEINNPLAAISATAEVILEIPNLNTDVKEYTDDILKCAQDAALIINDLNTYSRKGSAEPSNVDIVEAIQSALKMAMRGLDTDRITVSTDFKNTALVVGNINELQQVFLNLIVNGIQAMRGVGELTISITTESGNAAIEITDSGEGISSEIIEQVFDPFFTTKEPGEGTGLGLSIVHQIIYRHGGRITASSSPGEITSMRILLPLANAEPPTIRFVQARTKDVLEDVFYLQRKILVGEKGYREETIHRPTDTHGFHIVAYKGLQPIGTVTCVLDSDAGQLPVATHLEPGNPLFNAERMAEIDRLAVIAEERGGLAPLGLMILAYLYARSRNAQLVFLDIFTDDKHQLKLYLKVGFEEVCRYYDPLEVTVMVLRHRLNYETNSRRLNSFFRPLMARLLPRIDFEKDAETAILRHAESIIDGRLNSEDKNSR